ncbi:Virion host shutoff protein [Dissostichus eleginoides]|uniref:Virion host shutoff protein n=1 Tax=Dissostichus eleginoides TaxID=100907 RepID=A0AAD9BEQ9_DISEL|nr:Virion host shutoff protein [Dissostichus eleginoides]
MYRPGRNKWEAECTVCKACTYVCVSNKVQAILKRTWTQTNIGKLCKQKPPIVIKKFFENEFSEIYLWHMHSLMSAFHTHIQDMEKEKNSIMEVKKIMNSIHTILFERKSNNCMSLKVKGLLAQKRSDGLGKEYDQFCADVQGLYSTCLEYLEKWMTPMEEFSTFTWMDLSEPPEWNDVEACIKFLGEKGVVIDDVKCFDQVTNLKRFTERCNCDEEFSGLQGSEPGAPLQDYRLHVQAVAPEQALTPPPSCQIPGHS